MDCVVNEVLQKFSERVHAVSVASSVENRFAIEKAVTHILEKHNGADRVLAVYDVIEKMVGE